MPVWDRYQERITGIAQISGIMIAGIAQILRKIIAGIAQMSGKMKEELQNPVGHLQFLIVYSLNKIIILKYPGIIYFDIIYFA